MEPENHPFEKEFHLPNLPFLGSKCEFSRVYVVFLPSSLAPYGKRLDMTGYPRGVIHSLLLMGP